MTKQEKDLEKKKGEKEESTKELEEIIDHVKAETSALKKMIKSLEEKTNPKNK